MKKAAYLLGFALWLLVPACAFGAFGLTTTATSYTVDTDAGLVFKIRRTNNGSSTQSPGDIMNLIYKGVEYQDQSRGSQVNSGFDWIYSVTSAVTVSAATVGADYIKITVVCGDPAVAGSGVLTHYYMARRGDPCIYMATHFTSEPTGQALCRYILRIPSTVLPNGPTPSDIRNTDSTIESGDIFGFSSANANTALIGQTRSKHYSGMRLRDWSYIGATGTNVGMWVVRDNQEGGSGGPFYRSLLNQGGSDQEITYIVNYGEGQTEAFRPGILNSYTLVFTNGAPPSTFFDNSWFANMGLTGYIPPSGRGSVTCAGISNRDASQVYTVGFTNGTAQYYTTASAADGSFTMAGMIPGAYKMKVYRNEMAVCTASSVNVTAGATTTVNPMTVPATPVALADAPMWDGQYDPNATVPLWRIGNWDGTPTEFLYGDKINIMHPSDVRITGTRGTAAWVPGPYTIGSSAPATGIPCYQWKDVNGNQIVRFNLTQSQVVASTIRIGITAAYAGGRPNIAVNNWSNTKLPNPSTQPNSRTLTVGTFRGNNAMYTFSVLASDLVVGMNTLTISLISGSNGTTYLSPGYSLDCIDMYQGAAQTLNVPAAPTNLAAAPGDKQAFLSWIAPAGAATYTIKRALVSGGPYTTVAANVTATGYVDTGLLNGTTYYYVVAAANTSGVGVDSAQASVAPTGALASYSTYLKFDEAGGSVAADSSGSGKNGVLVNSSAFVAGKVNNAVSLSGTGHVTLPSGVVSGLNDFTVCAWVKLNSVSTWSRIFDFGTGQNAYMFLAPCATNATGKARFAINTGAGEQQINGASALPSGVWTHVAVTVSDSTGTLYVNGAVSGTNSAMTIKPFYLGSTTLNYIGRSQFSNDPYLDGLVDEFQIYGRALSAAEVAALALPPAAPTGLSATAGNAQATLNWAAPAGAASYTLKRGTASGQETTTVSSTITDTTFTDAGVANGTTYYYVVTASNSAGTSVNSSGAAVKPAQTCSQWIAAAFPGQTDSSKVGLSADPDGDGNSNALEYFLGTSASGSDAAGAISSAPDGQGNLVLNFRMAKNLTGISYSIRQSADLTHWTDSGVTATTVSDQGSYFVMKAVVPSNGQPRLFLRLLVTVP